MNVNTSTAMISYFEHCWYMISSSLSPPTLKHPLAITRQVSNSINEPSGSPRGRVSCFLAILYRGIVAYRRVLVVL
jgi:hypothetical protein